MLRRRLATVNDEQVAKVQHEREQMSEELLNLQQKISEQINTISDLEQVHNKVNEEMEQMTLLLAARETDIATLQGQDFHHIQQQLSKQLTEVKLENHKLKEQIKEQAINEGKVFYDKDTQNIVNSNNTTSVEELQRKFEQLQLEHAASETDLHSRVSKKEEIIISLREQVQQLTETLQMSQNSECHNCSQLTEKVVNFQLKFEPMEARVITLERQNSELTDEITRLQKDQINTSEVVISEKNQLQTELAKRSKELERLKTHLLQVSCLLVVMTIIST